MKTTTKTKVKTINKAAFDKMSVYKKRVAIAKDVLLQLELAKFVPQRGQYVTIKRKGKNALRPLRTDAAKPLIAEENSKCYVCAKGAIMCSYVRNFNNAVYDELKSGEMDETNDIFGWDILAKLEDEFEGFMDGSKKVPLKTLMENIIDNKGVYVDKEGNVYGDGIGAY